MSEIKLTEEVKQTYLWMLREFELIEKAMKPTRDHLRFMKENGHLEPAQIFLQETPPPPNVV